MAIITNAQIDKAKDLLLRGAEAKAFKAEHIPRQAIRAAYLELVCEKQDPENWE